MSAQHTPGPWTWNDLQPPKDHGPLYDIYDADGNDVAFHVNSVANARLIAAAPDLLALAHQYASECGECAGARVCPDDKPCTECSDIWAVIDRAEGRV